MRNFCNLFFLFVLFIGVANGQNVPQNVNYQSVIRNSTGSVIPNQALELKLSVLRGSALGTSVYQEIHSTSTNSLGLVNVKLGDGLATLSSFNQIDWAQDPFFLKVEIDTSGNGAFVNFGESEISSVPYALYSHRSMVTDSLSSKAMNRLPRLMLLGDTLFNGTVDTIYLNLSSYKLSESQVDSMVSNNGYLTFEKDSSTSNELQTLSINNNTLYLSITGDSIDLSPYLDNSTLTEAQVDTFVSNNGFLLQEVDGSVTNEIQDLIISNDSLYLSNISQPTKIDLSPYYDNTNLSESQVDSMVANNGYLLAEIDGSTTNEIQDLQLSNDTLSITGNSGANSIDLSPYLDDTVLDETQVDTYVSNNGYLTSEGDSSVTNEIQDLSNVLSQGNDANNQAIFNVSRQAIGQQNLDTSAVLEVNSTTQGFLPPRMSQAQRDSIYSPAAGLLVWCTDCGSNGLYSYYDGGTWQELPTTNSTQELWYEPWHMSERKNTRQNSSGSQFNTTIFNKTIYYHGFIQPATGVYNSMSIRFRTVDPASVIPPNNRAIIDMGIYTSNGNLADPAPSSLLGSGTDSILQFQSSGSAWNPSPSIVTEDEIFTVDFSSPISVIRGNIYYVAFQINYANYSNMNITLYESEDSGYQTGSKLIYNDDFSNFSGTVGLPSNANTLFLYPSDAPAYWFLLK